MADSHGHGRSLQDILGAPSSSRPTDRPSPGDVTTGTESEDMDYEATSDDDDASVDINDPEYIEAILRGDGEDYDEDNDEDVEEDEGISSLCFPSLRRMLNCPSFRWTVW